MLRNSSGQARKTALGEQRLDFFPPLRGQVKPALARELARLGLSTTDQYTSISLIWNFLSRNSVARTRKKRACCAVIAKLCSDTLGTG
jgi:hypothetical protein